jgi:heptaprenyl diphosphate synthase
MIVTNYLQEIHQIKEELLKKVEHPYLMKCIKLPAIDDIKLHLLLTILKEANVPVEKRKQYVIATMLVQHALDIHDEVTLTEAGEDEGILKERQLTVLAGDYFSGLYFQSLAKIGDIEMIQVLASGIKLINEYKIAVYHHDHQDIHQLLHFIGKIESSLIQEVAEYVELPNMKGLVSHICLLNRLIKERELFARYGASHLFDILKGHGKAYEEQGSIVRLIDKQVREIGGKIEVKLFHSFPIHESFQGFIRKLMRESNLMEKVVEEG